MLAYFFAWFGVMFPLVFSPGPANLAFAMSGIKQGVRASIGFLIGVDLVFLILSVMIGMGLGEVLLTQPGHYQKIKIIGLAYLCYLTVKFVRSPLIESESNINTETKSRFTFIDGVILQLMNPKGWVMLFTMFGVFFDGRFDQSFQLTLLVAWLFILNVITHLFWISAGKLIRDQIKKPKTEKIVRYSLSLSMASVIMWLFLTN